MDKKSVKSHLSDGYGRLYSCMIDCLIKSCFPMAGQPCACKAALAGKLVPMWRGGNVMVSSCQRFAILVASASPHIYNPRILEACLGPRYSRYTYICPTFSYSGYQTLKSSEIWCMKLCLAWHELLSLNPCSTTETKNQGLLDDSEPMLESSLWCDLLACISMCLVRGSRPWAMLLLTC